jgi:hypothetical protein
MNQNIPWGGAFYQVHFVLQTGATTADHSQTQSAFGPALFLEQGTQALRSILRNTDQLFVADLNSGSIRTGGPSQTGRILRRCFAHKSKITPSG